MRERRRRDAPDGAIGIGFGIEIGVGVEIGIGGACGAIGMRLTAGSRSGS